ncbi:hypothetical protein Tco_0583834 [Tanacetum coccineum]
MNNAAPSDGRFDHLPKPYGNLYALTGRKAHFLEDKQIPSVGVFDEALLYLYDPFSDIVKSTITRTKGRRLGCTREINEAFSSWSHDALDKVVAALDRDPFVVLYSSFKKQMAESQEVLSFEATILKLMLSNNSSAPHIGFLMEDLKEEVEQEGYLQASLMTREKLEIVSRRKPLI